MNIYITYLTIAALLLMAEMAYFRIADRCNIIDKPNERSSHSGIVLRGGGIIFLLGLWVWSAFFGFQYPWFLAAVTLVSGLSFVDDIRSLPDSVRLVAQFVSMALLFGELGMLRWELWWMVLFGLVVTVGATNVVNFMDGINGITGCYALSVLVPLILTNDGFVDESLLVVATLSVLVFLVFNFREKGRAKCFAGDVGSIGIGMILLFCIGKAIMATGDVTWLILLLVYGVDGCMTICHRILLHEKLGEAHRKHMYQLMANELKMSHRLISLYYAVAQLTVSLGYILLCPNTALAHWLYLSGSAFILALIYLLFMRKFYFLHAGYLKVKSMNTKELITALNNATTNCDAKEIIALTHQIGADELQKNPELEEAYRAALLQISD